MFRALPNTNPWDPLPTGRLPLPTTPQISGGATRRRVRQTETL